jgi:hypothetical protein
MAKLSLIDVTTKQPKAYEVVYAYEFNREAVQCKLGPNITMICIIVNDTDRGELIEYYWKWQERQHMIWHNTFCRVGKFEKILQSTPYGEQFKYQKDSYYWRKLSIPEIEMLCAKNVYIEIV